MLLECSETSDIGFDFPAKPEPTELDVTLTDSGRASFVSCVGDFIASVHSRLDHDLLSTDGHFAAHAQFTIPPIGLRPNIDASFQFQIEKFESPGNSNSPNLVEPGKDFRY